MTIKERQGLMGDKEKHEAKKALAQGLCFISFPIILILSCIFDDHHAEKQREIKKHGACKVLNGDPSIIRFTEIWPCNWAEKAVGENFKIVERLGEKQ